MATITKRGKRWYAQVRRKGFLSEGRTFDAHADAKAWAAVQEGKVETGDPTLKLKLLSDISLGDVIRRYLVEVTPTKRSFETEDARLRKTLLDPIASVPLSVLGSAQIADFRNRRMVTVKAGTIRRELSLIHHALDVARKEWGYRLVGHPVADVRLPQLRNARDRRLQSGELETLLDALSDSRNKLIEPVVLFAIESGMRRGEILSLAWQHVRLDQRVAHMPQTKTGRARTIPMMDAAMSILASLSNRQGRVFDLTPNAFKLAWVRAVKRSKLPNLRFHDLRHEAISRFAEMGLSTVELAVISGHRGPRMLFRYTHLRPQELAQKLVGRSWEAELQRKP